MRIVDRALTITRAQSLRELSRACAPAAILAWLVLSLYVLERVEGIRFLRPVFALLFVAAYAFRQVALSRFAGRRVRELLGEPAAFHASISLPLRASFWSGLELWLWLWTVVCVVRVEPWWVAALLPVFSLRAAIAPSFLAVLDRSTASTTGARVLLAALRHADRQRFLGISCELFLCAAALGLAFNFGAGLTLLISLAQRALGLELALMQAFLSPENHFGLLCIASVSLILLEPVRASLSAVLYADAENRSEGLWIKELVEKAISSPKRSLQRHVFCIALCGLLPLPAYAQSNLSEKDKAEELLRLSAQPCDLDCADSRARDQASLERIQRVLTSHVFREFPEDSWHITTTDSDSIDRWLDALLRHFIHGEQSAPGATNSGTEASIPTLTFFLLIATVALLLALANVALRNLADRSLQRFPVAPRLPESEDHTGDEHYFAEALRLLNEDPSAAMQWLYLAALHNLARRSLLSLSPAHANGHYLHALRERPEYESFAELTQYVNAVRYGNIHITPEALERCLLLVRSLHGKDAA